MPNEIRLTHPAAPQDRALWAHPLQGTHQLILKCEGAELSLLQLGRSEGAHPTGWQVDGLATYHTPQRSMLLLQVPDTDADGMYDAIINLPRLETQLCALLQLCQQGPNSQELAAYSWHPRIWAYNLCKHHMLVTRFTHEDNVPTLVDCRLVVKASVCSNGIFLYEGERFMGLDAIWERIAREN